MADKKPDDKAGVWEEASVDNEHRKTFRSEADGFTHDEILDDISPDTDQLRTETQDPWSAPKSQAVIDIQEAGMTPEEAAAASQALADKEEKKARKRGGRDGAEKLVTIARFRWILLLVLSLASVTAWAVDAQYSNTPYNWPAWGFWAFTLILTLATGKFLRLPTRSGLAALCWAATYFVGALFGPQENIFREIPAALPWAGVLTLIALWVLVAIWRKLGRYKIIDILLGLVVLYALFCPAWALIDNITAGLALNLKFSVLSASPDFLTRHLPWFLWPMTIIILGVLPLAALFAFWDQISALRRKGARHGGNFFLALAFLLLIPYGFLSFDQAVAECPEWAAFLRDNVYPEAKAYAREGRSAPPAVLETPRPESAGESRPISRPEPPAETIPAPPASSDTGLPKPPPLQNLQSAPVSPAPSAPAETVQPEIQPESQIEVPAPAPVPAEVSPAPPATEPAGPDPRVQDLEERLKNTEMKLEEALTRINELEERLMQQQERNSVDSGSPSAEEAAPSENLSEEAPQTHQEQLSPPVQAQPTTGERGEVARIFLIA